MTPFDEWWDKEGRDLFQRADGWLVAKAAWDAAIKAAVPPMRWNPNTSSMEPHNYSDDQKASK